MKMIWPCLIVLLCCTPLRGRYLKEKDYEGIKDVLGKLRKDLDVLNEEVSRKTKIKDGGSRPMTENEINVKQGILNPDGIELIDTSNQTGEKRGVTNNRLWPRDAEGNLRIPYNFTDTFSGQAQVSMYIAEINDFMRTCNTDRSDVWVPTSDPSVYRVLFQEGNGCSSFVGNVARFRQFGSTQTFREIGYQRLTLQPSIPNFGTCRVRGIVYHEMLHAMGFVHEQSRHDRDDYVTINFTNIIQGRENNFRIEEATRGVQDEIPYDYDSVMHYGRFDFSVDRNTRPTIILKKPYTGPFSDRLGQRFNMTEIDSYQLRLLYNCPNETIATTTTTTATTTTSTTSTTTTTEEPTTTTTSTTSTTTTTEEPTTTTTSTTLTTTTTEEPTTTTTSTTSTTTTTEEPTTTTTSTTSTTTSTEEPTTKTTSTTSTTATTEEPTTTTTSATSTTTTTEEPTTTTTSTTSTAATTREPTDVPSGLTVLNDSSLNIKRRCVRVILRCHYSGRWYWRRRHCRRYCVSREKEFYASISFDEIKTKLENLNGNFALDEGDDAFEDLSYCLRFNFRRSSANVTLSVDDVVTNQIQQLPWRRRWRWVEVEYNITAILSQFKVNITGRNLRVRDFELVTGNCNDEYDDQEYYRDDQDGEDADDADTEDEGDAESEWITPGSDGKGEKPESNRYDGIIKDIKSVENEVDNVKRQLESFE